MCVFYVAWSGLIFSNRSWLDKTYARPETSGTELRNITRQQFCSLPFLVLNIRCLLYLLSPIGIFSVICLFWHTLTARDDTRDKDANSSHQNDVTWCNFCRGNKSSSRSLASFCRRNIRYLLLVLRTCGVWVEPALWGQRLVTAKNKACNIQSFRLKPGVSLSPV